MCYITDERQDELLMNQRFTHASARKPHIIDKHFTNLLHVLIYIHVLVCIHVTTIKLVKCLFNWANSAMCLLSNGATLSGTQ